jgi:hypothetical protein
VATERQRAKNRGKQHEKDIARLLDGERVGVTGLPISDVRGLFYFAECKERKDGAPLWIQNALAQASRSASMTQLPIAILHKLGDRHGRDIVCMRFSDFQDWFGKGQVS